MALQGALIIVSAYRVIYGEVVLVSMPAETRSFLLKCWGQPPCAPALRIELVSLLRLTELTVPTCLAAHVSRFGWSAVSPSRPALSQSAACNGRQGKRAGARSHAQPPLGGEHGEHGEHWTLTAVARGATLKQARGVRPSRFPQSLQCVGKGEREAHQKA